MLRESSKMFENVRAYAKMDGLKLEIASQESLWQIVQAGWFINQFTNCPTQFREEAKNILDYFSDSSCRTA